jgi:site-specific recombinase XerD
LQKTNVQLLDFFDANPGFCATLAMWHTGPAVVRRELHQFPSAGATPDYCHTEDPMTTQITPTNYKKLTDSFSGLPPDIHLALEGNSSSDAMNPWCSIVLVQFKQVGCLPVLIDDGRINTDVLQFIRLKKERGKSASTLNRYTAGLGRFSDFMKWAGPRPSERPIVKAFFEALVNGKVELAWSGVGTLTAKSHVESVAEFIDIFFDNRGLESPNPLIDVPRSWASTVAEMIRRHRSDPLYHLFFTTKKSRNHKRRLFLPLKSTDQGLPVRARSPEKTFHLEEFILLIEREENPRDRMIWLLLGAGGLRESEVVHLFTSDISPDNSSSDSAVLLAHPTYGRLNSENKGPTRKAYLKQKYGLLPRNQLPYFDIHYAGWKGIRNQKNDTAGVTWLHPSFGASSWRSHIEYLSFRSAANAKHHPWYLVNLKRNNIGDPLTRSNLFQLLKAACKRLTLRSPSNPHALRHMYVDTLVHVLGMPLEEAQILVRHRDPESTAVYANISLELTRRALEKLGKLPMIPNLEPRF